MSLLFPYSYAVPAGGGEQGMGTMLTLRQVLAKTTVKNLHPEFRRRMVALMLMAALEGVCLGVGTGWRSYAQQLASYIARNGVGIAKPGNSNHEGNNQADDTDAIAADMVPASGQRWLSSDPVRLRSVGLICFRSSSNPAAWNEVEKRSYSTSSTQEWWHIQPVEVRYARSGRTWEANLRRWDIDPRFDIEHPAFNIDNPFGPAVEPPPVVPSSPPAPAYTPITNNNPYVGPFGGDSMLDAIAHYNGQIYCAIYTGGYKEWLTDNNHLQAVQGLAAMGGKDLSNHVAVSDPNVWKAFGPLVGPTPLGFDAYGLPL